MKQEKDFKASSGYLLLFLVIVLLAAEVSALILMPAVWIKITAAVMLIITLFLVGGFVIVNPNESSVLVLFGAYKGTIKENGFWWVNPFFTKENFTSRPQPRQ